MRFPSIVAGVVLFALSAASASGASTVPPPPVPLKPTVTTLPAPPAAPLKPAVTAPSGPFKPTANDVRICLGVDGSAPKDQITMCTKILASGTVKPPLTADYFAARAAAYFALNQFGPALADMNKALSVRQTPELYFERALLHIAREEVPAAKKDLAQVIRKAPEFAPAYFMRGVVDYRAGDHASALSDFDAAVTRVPTYYQALFARGVTKRKMGDETSGAKDIADARGMRPTIEDDMKPFGMTP